MDNLYIWLVVEEKPIWKRLEFVNWDDDFQYMGKQKMFQTTNQIWVSLRENLVDTLSSLQRWVSRFSSIDLSAKPIQQTTFQTVFKTSRGFTAVILRRPSPPSTNVAQFSTWATWSWHVPQTKDGCSPEQRFQHPVEGIPSSWMIFFPELENAHFVSSM